MATKANLRDRAAEYLGILRIGQGLQSQDTTRIESGYDEVFAQLKSDGLTTFASTGDCADELTPHIAYLIAESCLDTYSVSDNRYNRIVRGAEKGIREIKKFVQPRHEETSEPQDF